MLKDRVSDDASPADVEKAFRDAVKEHVQAVDGEALMSTSKHARQLRTLIDGAGGGARGAGGGVRSRLKLRLAAGRRARQRGKYSKVVLSDEADFVDFGDDADGLEMV